MKTFISCFILIFTYQNLLCNQAYGNEYAENKDVENNWNLSSKATQYAHIDNLTIDGEEILYPEQGRKILNDKNTIVTSTKRISLKGFPRAFNPSLIKFKDGFLLTFRYVPDPFKEHWISYIGVVRLNKSLRQISKPELLDTRLRRKGLSPSQSEDARIFSYNDDLYLVYNDNEEIKRPRSNRHRRDIYIAKLKYDNQNFSLEQPIKLYHPQKSNQLWQKNWTPFVWNNQLLLSYSITPHEILSPNLEDGACTTCYQTPTFFEWDWGIIRGGTPALLVDGEYLAFFHSVVEMRSQASSNIKMNHYFMGAYTFSSQPPFSVTKITPEPIIGKSFYTKSRAEKRVIYPGGYAISGSKIYVAYGKDDTEVWIGIIDKEKLKTLLQPIK